MGLSQDHTAAETRVFHWLQGACLASNYLKTNYKHQIVGARWANEMVHGGEGGSDHF